MKNHPYRHAMLNKKKTRKKSVTDQYERKTQGGSSKQYTDKEFGYGLTDKEFKKKFGY